MAAYKFTFIGTGNMGGALARAAAKSLPGAEILLSNRTPAKAEALARELGCAAGTAEQAAREGAYIFLGVKPQMMGDLLEDVAPVLAARQDRFVLVTMLCDANPLVTARELEDFSAALAGAGVIDRLDESLIDGACALTGCGPAFVCQFIEALADGGVACGLSRQKALLYAAQMAEGTARLMLATGQHPGEMKDAVCSPGGSTIAGVYALERGGLRAAAMEAVMAAEARNRELGRR